MARTKDRSAWGEGALLTAQETHAKPILMTVMRNGTLTVKAEEVEGKCGNRGLNQFRYEVWLTATDSDLDSRGFIVDNAEVENYFRDEYTTKDAFRKFVSCELMGLKFISDFRRLYPNLLGIEVRIWGLADVTYVESQWEAK